mgnify:CR=1 FL=1
MRKDYVTEVANEILKLLRIGAYKTLSWGVDGLNAVEYEDKPALKFHANGFAHKGVVVMALDDGKDLYEIHLLNDNGGVKKSVREIHYDHLVDIADVLIETGSDGPDEYRERVEEWLATTPL